MEVLPHPGFICRTEHAQEKPEAQRREAAPYANVLGRVLLLGVPCFQGFPQFTTHFHSREYFPLSLFLTVRPWCNSLFLWSLELALSELRPSAWPASPSPSLCLLRDQLKACTGSPDTRAFSRCFIWPPHLTLKARLSLRLLPPPAARIFTLPTLLSLSPTLIGCSGASF